MPQVATYDYTNERGDLLYQVVRYKPKEFRQRRPLEWGYGANVSTWDWSLGDVRRVLYRLPEVVEGIQSGRWIFLCEGEKDADNMATAGFCSTTACGGTGSANKFGGLYGNQLRGAYACILPDNDKPSRKWAETIAKQLHGVVRGVKIVQLLYDPSKADASDWLEHRKSTTEYAQNIIEAMGSLIKSVPWCVPPPEPVIVKRKCRYKYVGTDMTFQAMRDHAHAIPIADITTVIRKMARCPVPSHEDVHPSCTINDNLWWCTVCGVGGDTIRWVEVRDDCQFPAAVKTLCGGA